MPTSYYAIEDLSQVSKWIKTVSPMYVTNILTDVKEYTVLADANADFATLNAIYPGRFHVVPSPKGSH